MMSAVDKLHKLYASTSPPVVWARSTGIEVLNELDTLKAGIIGAAGGRSNAPGSLWEMVAGGVEALSSGTRIVGAVRTGLRTVADGVLQQAVRVVSKPNKNL